jgi:hypothetical protein
MFENIKFKIGDKDIKGAGGGGNAQPDGGNVSLKPPSASSSLFQSVAFLSVLDLVSDGPLDGFSNPIDGTRAIGTETLSSIYYDDLPLKQPTKRNMSLADIKGSSIRNVGIFANDENQPTSFGNAISGLIDEVDTQIDFYTPENEPETIEFVFIQTGVIYGDKIPNSRPPRYEILGMGYSLELTNSGYGYPNNFDFNMRFYPDFTYNDVSASWEYQDEYRYISCYTNQFGVVTGMALGDLSEGNPPVDPTTNTLSINLPEGPYPYIEFSLDEFSIPETENKRLDRILAQLDNYKHFLQSVKQSCAYETKSPFGYIQYNLGDNFDFTLNGAQYGIKIHTQSKSYVVNTFNNSGDLYERSFQDQLGRSFKIPASFSENSFKVNEQAIDPPSGKIYNIYDVTGVDGDNFLLFYIGTGEHSGAGGSFLTGKFLTTAGNTAVIDAGTNNGYDVFATGDNYIKLASKNSLQTYPFTGDVYDKNIKVGFFTENFENLNFNNISVDYVFGEENQDSLLEYSQGSRNYNINHKLYGKFIQDEDTDERSNREFANWDPEEPLEDYDEFSYTHIIQQREVIKAVPTIAIQQLHNTVAYSGDAGYVNQDKGNVGTKRDETLTIVLEYGFEGDRVPLGYEYDDTAPLEDGLISGAAAQGISPQSIALLSYKKVSTRTFEGMVESPFYSDIDKELGDLPKNSVLKNLTYGDVFNATQLGIFNVNSGDVIFPNDTWKDINRYLKVRKQEAETQSVLIKRSCSLHSITERINSDLSYPFSAAVGNRVDARSFSQAPNRTYLMKMKKVKIPSNYYPLRPDGSDKRFITDEDNYSTLNQIYYGEWDGTFRFAWTDNPAWILYDLITNTRYGIGNQIDDFEDVDIFELYIIGRYCDAVDNDGKFVGVKDGRGGLEPRFACNIAIDQKQNAFQLIGNIAAIFRGIVYWNAGTLNFSVDRPKPISAIFNNENAYDGMFTYNDVSAQNRFTRVTASYVDKNDDYKMKKEYVDDEEAIRNYGLIIKDVDALGCTSRSQARRMAKYVLLSNKLETEAVQFKTDARALTLSPGDIIRIDDELKHFETNYGKVLDVNVLNGYIDIDNQINTGNIALDADSALYLYNDSMDQNDLRTLYDISKYNDNGILAGESLTLAAMNNQDTHNLIAKLGEQYTGFDTWTSNFDSITQSGTDGSDTLFGYKYFGIQDSSASTKYASLTGFNRRIENGETYCLSTFVNTGAIDPSEEWVFRILFQKFDQSDPTPISQLTGQIGMQIKNGSLSQWVEPANWADNFEIINSGIYEEIDMPGIRWSRPYISVKTKTNGVTLSGIVNQLIADPNSAQDTVQFTLPQLELGEIPTPFNSNDFHANNFINKFTVTGVADNPSSNGYRLYVDKDTVEYSTFNEVPIGSYFNVKLNNQIDELYKIIKISPDENNLYAIEGLQYYSGKFDQIENLDFSDYSNLTNIGIPVNTITRPAPVLYPEFIYYSAQDEYGLYYLSIDVSKLGLSSAEKYRVTMISPNGSYLSKEVSIEEEGATNIRFNNLIAGEYTVYVASIRNPESKVIKPTQIKIG